MNKQVKVPKRSKDCIKLFIEHGPLSISTLNSMLLPPMKVPKIRKLLTNLIKKGVLINSKYNGLKSFYYLSQRQKNINLVAKKFNFKPEQLINPGIHGREWIHNEICEYWIYLLKKQYPDCTIIREKDFIHNDFAKRALIITNYEQTFKPDFLFILPESQGSELVIIAFEIERTKKQKNRLNEKLLKYTDRSFVDGIFYVCSEEDIMTTISTLFKNKIIFESLRIGSYGEKFILFSDNFNTKVKLNDPCFDVIGRTINFNDWIWYLKQTPRNLRTNEMLKRE